MLKTELISIEIMFQVKNIVQGSFKLFQSMYGPLLHEYVSERLLKISSFGGTKSFKQVAFSYLILVLMLHFFFFWK